VAARLAVAVMALFVAASGFMLFLSSGTLAELARRVHLSAYRRLGERIRVSVERGLRFGRPLEGYAGLSGQLDNASGMTDGMDGMMVVDSRGNPVAVSGSTLPGGQFRHLPTTAGTGESDWSEINGRLVLAMPLTGRAKRLEGYLILVANPARVRMERERFWELSLGSLVALTAVLAIGLFIRAASTADAPGEGRLADNRRRLCLIAAGGGQILYCLLLMWFFAGALSAAEKAKIAVTARAAVWDLERLAGKGLRPAQVRGIEAYLGEILRDNPEILALGLVGDGRTATAGEPPSAPPLESRPIIAHGLDRTPAGFEPEAARLDFWMNPAGVRGGLWSIGRNLVTALAVALLLLNEMTLFVIPGGRAGFGRAALSAGVEAGDSGAGAARVAAFAFFFAYDMSMSFVPLVSSSLPGDIWFFPKSVVQALPLTLEAAATGAGTLLAGHRLFGAGMAARFRIGIGAAALGSLLSWLATSSPAFCAARLVAGFGFGMFFMSSQSTLIKGEGRAGRLGELYSGILSGSLCGMTGGAMAAELLGFGRIFAASAVAFLPALLIAGHGLDGGDAAPAPAPADGRLAAVSRRGQPRFFLSFDFLGQVALIAVPASMILAGLVFYSIPVLLERTGTAQGDIGRVMMLHGLGVILAGPVLGRLADAGRNYTLWIALAGGLGALAVIMVRLWPSLPGYALATTVCGLGSAMLIASGMARIAGLAAAKGLAAGMAGGVYRFAERLGQMLGPLAFGFLLGRNGGVGLLWLGALALAGATVFFVARGNVAVAQGEKY
jgi:predicted MFS family arabinose efflux permease